MSSPAAARDQFLTTVVANIPLCREHFRLVLRAAKSFPPTAPGQFIQISCRQPEVSYSSETEVDWQPGRPLPLSGREMMAPLALLRRPFSLAGRRDTPAGVELDVIHRVVGVGTDWLSRLTAGDQVDILGPLGNTFQLPPPDATAILIGGGVGIPPMIYLAQHLAGRSAVAFSGALTHDLLPLAITGDEIPGPEDVTPRLNVDEFARHGIPTILATDDGSYGFRGYVTQAVEQWLQGQGASGKGQVQRGPHLPLAPRSSPLVLYTCGPEPMMKRVADLANRLGIECQIAVERAMACGMGTCQSCCIRVRKKDPRLPPLAGLDWCWRLACTDGPVFRAAELLW